MHMNFLHTGTNIKCVKQMEGTCLSILHHLPVLVVFFSDLISTLFPRFS